MAEYKVRFVVIAKVEADSREAAYTAGKLFAGVLKDIDESIVSVDTSVNR